ncbi:MAG: type II toxin-antitoxin system RelE/ParE family toxin [Armatimonadetes bacterium]|nr:type II toxin-antitoxin system RelE/ParE family toxin [Armatimonadota bacterium]
MADQQRPGDAVHRVGRHGAHADRDGRREVRRLRDRHGQVLVSLTPAPKPSRRRRAVPGDAGGWPVLPGAGRGYWKIRVGDYRIVYRVTGRDIRVLAVRHRRDIYPEADTGAERGRGLGRIPLSFCQLASVPDITRRPASITLHGMPAWNGCPAAKRHGR